MLFFRTGIHENIHILEWGRHYHLLCDCNTTVQSIGRESTADHHCTCAWSQALANTGRRIIFHCFTVSSNPNGLHETLSQEKDPNKKRKHIINRVVMGLKETASCFSCCCIYLCVIYGLRLNTCEMVREQFKCTGIDSLLPPCMVQG